MAECPQCGNEIRSAGKCACGWRAVPEKRDGNPYRYGIKVGDHWVSKGCAWNNHGHTCDEYGPLSLGTNGEGPWYCRKHFGELMRWATDKIVPVEGQVGKVLERIKMREPGEELV